MKTIWKYPLEARDQYTLELPVDAKVLTVQDQGGLGPQLWALVDPNAPTTKRKFHVVGTGHDATRIGDSEYVATFQLPGLGLVFHVFEES